MRLIGARRTQGEIFQSENFEWNGFPEGFKTWVIKSGKVMTFVISKCQFLKMLGLFDLGTKYGLKAISLCIKAVQLFLLCKLP